MDVTEKEAMTKQCCVDVTKPCVASNCMGWRWTSDGYEYRYIGLSTKVEDMLNAGEGWERHGAPHEMRVRRRLSDPVGCCGRAEFDVLVEQP